MKALIAIYTCGRPKYKERIQTLQETWIPLAAPGTDIRFFDGERLGVPDDYFSLPQKTKALCKYALQHGYDYMLKVDDDTYIHPDRLALPDADYAGIFIKANDCGFPPRFPNSPKGTHPFDYASGGAYWLSRRAMEIVVDAEIDDWAEDRWVGQALARQGIKLKVLPDYLFFQEFSIEPYLRREFTLLTQIPSSAQLRLYHQKYALKTPHMFDVSREEFRSLQEQVELLMERLLKFRQASPQGLDERLSALERRIAKYNQGDPHKI